MMYLREHEQEDNVGEVPLLHLTIKYFQLQIGLQILENLNKNNWLREAAKKTSSFLSGSVTKAFSPPGPPPSALARIAPTPLSVPATKKRTFFAASLTFATF